MEWQARVSDRLSRGISYQCVCSLLLFRFTAKARRQYSVLNATMTTERLVTHAQGSTWHMRFITIRAQASSRRGTYPDGKLLGSTIPFHILNIERIS